MVKKTIQKEAEQVKTETVQESFDPYAVIKAPLSTEKNIRQI